MAEKSKQESRQYPSWIPEEARQHAREARQEMRESIKSLFPPEFIEHRRKARREILLAWRSMIDRAIQHIDEKIK